MPYCTEGGDNPFKRILDDGKTCYWDLDCDNYGRGWSSEKVTAIKPLYETEALCDCSLTGTCGEGYCTFTENGKTYCYYGVKCAYGGWWPEGLVECTGGECRADGCHYREI